MSDNNENFFTRVGCMDGRIQIPIRIFGQQKFKAEYPDTITEAGIVSLLAKSPSPELLKSVKEKILISLNIHNSKGILVFGHQDCAGDPVDDDVQIKQIIKSTEIVKNLINNRVTVIGIFVKRFARDSKKWVVQEL